MKRALILLLTVVTASAYAQAPDSLSILYDTLPKTHLTPIDSISNRFNTKIDAAQQRLNNLISPDFSKLNSLIQKPQSTDPDSLRAIHELDSLKSGLTHKIDSLKTFNLPTARYTAKLDSLNQIGPAKYVQMARERKQQLEAKVAKPIGDVSQKINQPLTQVEQKINKPVSRLESKVNDKLNLMRQEGGTNASLPGNLSLDKVSVGNTDITSALPSTANLNVPGADVNNPLGELSNPLGKVDNPIGNQAPLGDLANKANGLTQLPQQQIDKVKSIDEIQTVKETAGNINGATDKMQSYGKDVTSIAQGNVGDVEQIPASIEAKAKSLDEIKELEKQTGELNKAKGFIDKGNDREALKEMGKQEITKRATDHFAGKQEALKNAMDKLSQMKSKYSEVKSVADLAKRPPNPMKGKPFIERVIPGVTLQILKGTNFMFDINPVVSYRITGHINAGLGWNERLSFAKWNKLNPNDRIFGPRVFGSYSFRKGFGLKAEIEKMNSAIPTYALSADAGTRQWVWSAFVGMKKDYKFIGKVNGNVQVLYNLYDDHDNSPYSDRLNVRMGFEFPMKRKPR